MEEIKPEYRSNYEALTAGTAQAMNTEYSGVSFSGSHWNILEERRPARRKTPSAKVFLSDCSFRNRKIIEFEATKPFSLATDRRTRAAQRLSRHWNSVAGERDSVWHLGSSVLEKPMRSSRLIEQY